MAEIVDGGLPANDAERLVLKHLAEHAPDDWVVLHNVEVPVRGDCYEIDLVVINGRGVCLVDVKGTRGVSMSPVPGGTRRGEPRSIRRYASCADTPGWSRAC